MEENIFEAQEVMEEVNTDLEPVDYDYDCEYSDECELREISPLVAGAALLGAAFVGALGVKAWNSKPVKKARSAVSNKASGLFKKKDKSKKHPEESEAIEGEYEEIDEENTESVNEEKSKGKKSKENNKG